MRRIISILFIARMIQRLMRGAGMGPGRRSRHQPGRARQQPGGNPRQAPAPRPGDDEPPQGGA